MTTWKDIELTIDKGDVIECRLITELQWPASECHAQGIIGEHRRREQQRQLSMARRVFGRPGRGGQWRIFRQPAEDVESELAHILMAHA